MILDEAKEYILPEIEEQQKIFLIKEQINLVWQEIYSIYTQIGKRYVAYATKNGDIPEVDAYELLLLINEKNLEKQELESQIEELLFS